jgi:hypothetical protein
MYGTVTWWLGKFLIPCCIVEVEQVGGMVRIAFACPDYYFSGNMSFSRNDIEQTTTGSITFAAGESNTRLVSITGRAKSIPSMAVFKGVCVDSDDATATSEVQVMLEYAEDLADISNRVCLTNESKIE